MRRTAQLAYDPWVQGAGDHLQLPSQGTLTGYNRDARNVELSADSLRAVLSDVSKKANVKRIHLIAHSMGNRAVVGALSKIGNDVTVRQVALIAPDIDAELFRRLARGFPSNVGPITLYASSRDSALVAAARFAGYPRAGQGGPDLVVVAPGIETVDAFRRGHEPDRPRSFVLRRRIADALGPVRILSWKSCGKAIRIALG